MLDCIYVGAGGFIGSVCRYLLGRIPLKTGFPKMTLLINIMGAFILGFITAAASKDGRIDEHALLFLRVGLCGGFTTFSTFSLESANMIRSGAHFLAFIYVLLSTILCVAAIFGAQALTGR
jgi:CrcB protein